MNILVIGNGFDLAHGLPTKYGDFLDFIECVMIHKKSGHLDDEKFKKFHCNSWIEKFSKKYYEEYKIFDNFWINYFKERKNLIGEGWVDFELEISKYIQNLECKYKNSNINLYSLYIDVYNKGYLEDDKKEHFKNTIKKISSMENKTLEDRECIYKNIIYKLENDLDNLILFFEIYLKYIVEKENINKIVLDINSLKIDKVISFNYTHTFQKKYQNGDIEYDFIHGEVRENVENGFNNMVLGIDEYLTDDNKNKNLTFTYFKKYFQRIWKRTGSKYKKWLNTKEPMLYSFNFENSDSEKVEVETDYYFDEKEKINIKFKNIYFFGHSLDSSDKDILEEIIKNETTKIKIFYINREQLKNQISNLVKILGQDDLIEMTYNENKKIEFIKQNEV